MRRAARATQLRLLRQRQLTDSTTNAHTMQQQAAQGLRSMRLQPAQLGQLGSVDASARCPAASAVSSTSTVAVPVVDHRCGLRAHQPRRQARQRAARGCRDESWLLTPPTAASGSGEALRRLRGGSQTSRRLPGRFFCTPGGRSQRRLRRSPTPKIGAAFMGDSPHVRGRNGSVWGRCWCLAAGCR